MIEAFQACYLPAGMDHGRLHVMIDVPVDDEFFKSLVAIVERLGAVIFIFVEQLPQLLICLGLAGPYFFFPLALAFLGIEICHYRGVLFFAIYDSHSDGAGTLITPRFLFFASLFLLHSCPLLVGL